MTSGIPADVDKLLDASMQKALFDTVIVGSATYYFIDQYDDVDGEPVIVRKVGGQQPQLVNDILPEDDTGGGGAATSFSPKLRERLDAIRGVKEESENDAAGGAGLLNQSQLSRKFQEQAERCTETNSPEHLSSANAPGTNNGRLACAWAVNRVAKMALGKSIGGGLATANMVIVLRDSHHRTNNLVSGCVIISPTVSTPNGRNIGHVGIVGLVNQTEPNRTKIYSNSSSRARFEQNFTYATWVQRYKETKGLSVELFQLEPSLFPSAGV